VFAIFANRWAVLEACFKEEHWGCIGISLPVAQMPLSKMESKAMRGIPPRGLWDEQRTPSRRRKTTDTKKNVMAYQSKHFEAI